LEKTIETSDLIEGRSFFTLLREYKSLLC